MKRALLIAALLVADPALGATLPAVGQAPLNLSAPIFATMEGDAVCLTPSLVMAEGATFEPGCFVIFSRSVIREDPAVISNTAARAGVPAIDILVAPNRLERPTGRYIQFPAYPAVAAISKALGKPPPPPNFAIQVRVQTVSGVLTGWTVAFGHSNKRPTN